MEPMPYFKQETWRHRIATVIRGLRAPKYNGQSEYDVDIQIY